MKVQQEVMRHASIQTTMNVYGRALSSSKREANGRFVEMVLKPLLLGVFGNLLEQLLQSKLLI